MPFWVYILSCADGSYYTGHTDNLEHRFAQHEAGEISGCHTHARRPVVLSFAQEFASREEALALELQVKRWSRAKKEALMASDWKALSGLAKRRTPRGSIAPVSIDRSAVASTSAPHHEREISLSSDLGEAWNETAGRGYDRTIDRSAVDSTSTPHHERAGGSAARVASADEQWIRHALALADRAEREDDEIPVGAVLIDADGTRVGEGWNRNIAEHDPTAHAEIVAMRQAGKRIGNHRLVGSTLYVTLEPCAMCAMAMVHARIARLVFAAADPKTGAAGSVFDLLADPRHNHRVAVQGGVMAAEASARLSAYFARKRGGRKRDRSAD